MLMWLWLSIYEMKCQNYVVWYLWYLCRQRHFMPHIFFMPKQISFLWQGWKHPFIHSFFFFFNMWCMVLPASQIPTKASGVDGESMPSSFLWCICLQRLICCCNGCPVVICTNWTRLSSLVVACYLLRIGQDSPPLWLHVIFHNCLSSTLFLTWANDNDRWYSSKYLVRR